MTSMPDGVRAAIARARAANVTTNTCFPMAEISESAWMKLQLGFLHDEGVAIGLFLGGGNISPWENVLSQINQPYLWEILAETYRNIGDPDVISVRAHWGINSKGQRTVRFDHPTALHEKMMSFAHPGDEFGLSTPVPEPASEPELEDNDDNDEEWEKIDDNGDDDDEWENIEDAVMEEAKE